MTYDELPDAIRRNHGLLKVDMGTLRDMAGFGKLGTYVRQGISTNLTDRGLGYFPEQLPINQHEEVRLYERDTRIGRLVMAVFHPSPAGDKAIRVVGGDEDDRELLDQVRKLLAVGA